jgi:hypothetical protein
MKLKELIYRNEWLSVEYTLIDLYPDSKEFIEDYKRIFYELKQIVPAKNNIILEMDRMWEDGKESNLANVYGHDPTLPDTSITKGIAVEFRPWNEWLDFEIGMDAKEEWNELEMICHSLIEMTLDGLTQEEIQENQQYMIGEVIKIRDEYFNDKQS